ncbi:MFS transporter [Arthrobacter sp. Sa2CUA1]|uniref:MFS transporter n=1 Tax=Arthrobacter gallicola TaxID=2762225 RepID=A0ABR8UW37_9MICC|nr:MFS transporter [Arthrobacter gallicola]MBD7996733.1 MFS transporter [Arthrobacter gallicola]
MAAGSTGSEHPVPAPSPTAAKALGPEANGIGTNRDALRVPAFRGLTLAWVFTNFGNSALFLTAAIWVKQLTGSDAAAGLVFVALGLPALLAPLIGQLADRFRRKPLLVINNFCSATVVLVLLFVQTSAHLWLVYVVIFTYATSNYVTTAAQSGLLRDMLTDRLLAPANGLLSSVNQGLRIISPLIGAGMLSLWGMQAVVLLTSLCFVVTALILITLKVQESDPGAEAEDNFWQSTTAGLRFLAHHQLLAPAMLCLSIAIGATGILNVTIFATVEQGLGMPPEFLSVLVSVQGAMAIAGGFTASILIRKFGIRTVIILGVALLAAAVLASAIPSVPVVLTGSVLTGLGVTWTVIAFITLRQTESPARLQGRTSAATSMLINVPQVGANMIAAALISSIDYRALIITTSVVCLAGALPLLLRRSSVQTRGAGGPGGGPGRH